MEAGLTEKLAKALACDITEAHEVSGGCIHQSYRLQTDLGPFFLKTSHNLDVSLFEAEIVGLEALRAVDTVRVPEPILAGSSDSCTFLLLEWIDLLPISTKTQAKLGTQLAELHLGSVHPRFGFGVDNVIGSTPQSNGWMDNWVDFFRVRRLEPQLKLAGGQLEAQGMIVCERLETFFDEEPSACLIHGDLWSGNVAMDSNQMPVLFDPATYYADSEAEFGIVQMFGGFSRDFYQQYEELIPQKAGSTERRQLYQLYHTLNHYNLFGSSYLQPALDLVSKLS